MYAIFDTKIIYLPTENSQNNHTKAGAKLPKCIHEQAK